MTFWHFDTFWGFKTAPVWSHRHWLSDCRYNPKGVAMVCYGWWMLAVWLVFSTVPKRPWEPLPLGQVGHLTAAWTDSDQGLRKFHTEVLRKKTKACRRYEGNYMILHVITRSVVFWLVHPISVLIRNSCFAYFFACSISQMGWWPNSLIFCKGWLSKQHQTTKCRHWCQNRCTWC